MSKQICPICNKGAEEVNSWVKCPKLNSSVCMKHCFGECEHMDEGTSLPRCNYMNVNKREKEKAHYNYIEP